MRTRLRFPAFVLAVTAAGCGAIARFESAPLSNEAALRLGGPVRIAFLLLGAKEGIDIDELDAGPMPGEPGGPGGPGEKDAKRQAPAEGAAGGFLLKVGGGVAMPGSGAIGSAPASTVPAYSDVWAPGTVFDAVGEFGAGKKLRPYAQLSISQFAGQTWTNPGDPNDSWLASDSSLMLLAGGVRFGGSLYAKAGAGLLLWPEVMRIDALSGYEEPMFSSGATLAFTVGGGAEFKLGKLKAYVDAELILGAAPERGENAVVFWPNFEAAGMSSFKLAGGLGISF